MARRTRVAELPYEARARLADNLFLARMRVEHTQRALGEQAAVSAARIGMIENGKVVARLDIYVRLAGALALSLDDLLAGVRWTPASIESEIEAGYVVEFEVEASEGR